MDEATARQLRVWLLFRTDLIAGPVTFGAAPGSHLRGLSFEGQGAFPTQGGVPSAWIVEAVDVFEGRNLGSTCIACAKGDTRAG